MLPKEDKPALPLAAGLSGIMLPKEFWPKFNPPNALAKPPLLPPLLLPTG